MNQNDKPKLPAPLNIRDRWTDLYRKDPYAVVSAIGSAIGTAIVSAAFHRELLDLVLRLFDWIVPKAKAATISMDGEDRIAALALVLPVIFITLFWATWTISSNSSPQAKQHAANALKSLMGFVFGVGAFVYGFCR